MIKEIFQFASIRDLFHLSLTHIFKEKNRRKKANYGDSKYNLIYMSFKYLKSSLNTLVLIKTSKRENTHKEYYSLCFLMKWKYW